jgi:sugar/nucleoside kinase (ribokinase family)
MVSSPSNWKVVSYSTDADIEPSKKYLNAQWKNVHVIDGSRTGVSDSYELIVYSLPEELDGEAVKRFILQGKTAPSPTIICHVKHLSVLQEILLRELNGKLQWASNANTLSATEIKAHLDHIAAGAEGEGLGVNIQLDDVFRVEDTMKDAIGILGAVGIDLFVDIKEWPRTGTEIIARSMKQQSGGRGYASAIQVARLDSWFAAPIALLGDKDDQLTKSVLSDMELIGLRKISLDGLSHQAKTQADITVVLNENNQAGYIRKENVNRPPVNILSAAFDRIADRLASLLVCTDLSVAAAEALLKKARAAKIPSVLYVVASDIIPIDVAKNADYIIVSPDVAISIVGRDDTKENLALELAHQTNATILVTDSFGYCHYVKRPIKGKADAVPVEGFKPNGQIYRLGVRSAFSASFTTILAEEFTYGEPNLDKVIRFALAAGTKAAETGILSLMPLRSHLKIR